MRYLFIAFAIILAAGDLLFFLVAATGWGVPAIALSQLFTGCAGWIAMRKLDFNLLFFVEARLKNGEPVVREIWDELLLLSGACLLVYPGVLTDLVGFSLLLGEAREAVLDFLGRSP